MLRIYTLAIQKGELKELFRRDEINESIYKKNMLILDTQTEKVKQDRPKLESLNAYLSSYKTISSLIRFLRGVPTFAKAHFGHPSPSSRQKLNGTDYNLRCPDSPCVHS
jgi:hypothetical protein